MLNHNKTRIDDFGRKILCGVCKDSDPETCPYSIQRGGKCEAGVEITPQLARQAYSSMEDFFRSGGVR